MNDKNTEIKASDLLSRLDGYRASYFMDWFLPLWGNDKRRLQDVSVRQVIEKYEKEKQSQTY